jgi:hypothetical protein
MRHPYISLSFLLLPIAPVAAQDAPASAAQKICLAPASVEAAPSGFQTKDEFTLAWRLEGPNGAELKEGKEKKKAKSDGEDLLTPLVQSAAEAIAAAVAGN